MPGKILFFSCLLFIIHPSAMAQTGLWESDKVPKWEVRGYLKYLHSETINGDFDSLVNGNLIHSRLNIKWKPNGNITGAAEFRTRLFWGEEFRSNPDFSEQISRSREAVNTSLIWFETPGMLMQTYMDRFWLEYQEDTWDVRIGKQRINWGIGTLWNPNDIFNTYNFLDFDYEERPGSDAVKFRYNFSGMSNVQLAVAVSDKKENTVAAVKYFANKWNYDFQFSGGVYRETFTLGTGWSGSIKNVGFKGEIQYFAAHRDSTSQLNLVLESDYLFSKGWYLNLGLLVNSKGISDPDELLNLSDFQLSTRNLMPTKWNLALTGSKQIFPLMTASLSGIVSPGTKLLILLPSVQYNLATNLDVDFFWQAFFAEQNDDFEGIVHRGFLRGKFSF